MLSVHGRVHVGLPSRHPLAIVAKGKEGGGSSKGVSKSAASKMQSASAKAHGGMVAKGSAAAKMQVRWMRGGTWGCQCMSRLSSPGPCSVRPTWYAACLHNQVTSRQADRQACMQYQLTTSG
jgi:hypothetical protein